jgi:hypothetical protein
MCASLAVKTQCVRLYPKLEVLEYVLLYQTAVVN